MSYSLMVTRFYCGDAEKMEADVSKEYNLPLA